MKTTGNPSGSANTIVDNTLALYMLLAFAWLKLCPQTRSTSRSDFERNVSAVLNGDDNTFTVSDECVKWFNSKEIIRVWHTLGVEAESGVEEQPTKLDNVHFISQSFKKHWGVWYPVPETDRVVCSLAFASKLKHPLFSLMKAYALRLTSYGNDFCRDVISRYIVWLKAKYKEEMLQTFNLEGENVTPEKVDSMFKSDIEIRALYEGFEGSRCDNNSYGGTNFDFDIQDLLMVRKFTNDDRRTLAADWGKLKSDAGQLRSDVANLELRKAVGDVGATARDSLILGKDAIVSVADAIADEFKHVKQGKKSKQVPLSPIKIKRQKTLNRPPSAMPKKLETTYSKVWRGDRADEKFLDEEERKVGKLISDADGFISKNKAREAWNKSLPGLPLVGVELNPGPRSRAKKVKISVKKMKKKASRNSVMSGIGISSSVAPVAISYKTVMKNKLRNTIVTHCEQLLEVPGAASGSYTVAGSFPINPGLVSTFPWLSQVAAQYESYEFKSLRFIFVPYVSSATAGYVAMNFDYNPQEEQVTQFPNKQAFTDYDGAVQCNSWEAFELAVKCPNLEGPRKRTLRATAPTGQYDLHNYDHGQLNIAVGSQGSSSTIGTLYACYSVSLERPRISSVGSGAAILSTDTNNISSGVAKTSIFGPVSTTPITALSYSTMFVSVSASGSLGSAVGTLVLNSSQSISSPIDNNNAYLIQALFVGTGFALSTANVNSLSVDSHYTIIHNLQWAVNEDGTVLFGGGMIQSIADGTNDHVGFNFTSANLAATTITSFSVRIAQVPYSIQLTRAESMMKKVAREMLEEYESSRDKQIFAYSNYPPVEIASSSSYSSSVTPALVSPKSWDTVSRTSLRGR